MNAYIWDLEKLYWFEPICRAGIEAQTYKTDLWDELRDSLYSWVKDPFTTALAPILSHQHLCSLCPTTEEILCFLMMRWKCLFLITYIIPLLLAVYLNLTHWPRDQAFKDSKSTVYPFTNSYPHCSLWYFWMCHPFHKTTKYRFFKNTKETRPTQ